MEYTNLFIGSKLPNTLSQKEMDTYFKNFKAGDLEAREKLIIHNIKLVIYCVKKINAQTHDKEELVSVGLIGLIKAVDTFDLSKLVTFSTYASTCIHNEILNFIKSQEKHLIVESLETPLSFNNSGSELKLQDKLNDKNIDLINYFEKKEIFLTIRNLIDNLPTLEKNIIMYYFGFSEVKPLTQQEISKKLNVSRPKISITIAKVLNIIRDNLQEEKLIYFPKRIRNKIKKNH